MANKLLPLANCGSWFINLLDERESSENQSLKCQLIKQNSTLPVLFLCFTIFVNQKSFYF